MGKNSFQMFKVKKAFEHGHQVLLVALQNHNRGIQSNNDVTSILSHLIRADDEMIANRLEEKKELFLEWEAIQKRKERSHNSISKSSQKYPENNGDNNYNNSNNNDNDVDEDVDVENEEKEKPLESSSRQKKRRRNKK